MEDTDIHALIDSATDLARLGDDFKEIAIEKNYDDAIPPMRVDRASMEQVFLNVVTNALQAIRDGQGRGTVRIQTLLEEGGQVRIRFTDNGPGMSPEVRAKIFDPFFTTKVVGHGVGLGLSVAHGIVLQHGGRIFVERTGPGGTTVAMKIPIEPPDPAHDFPHGKKDD